MRKTEKNVKNYEKTAVLIRPKNKEWVNGFLNSTN